MGILQILAALAETLILTLGILIVLLLVLLHHARVLSGRLPLRRTLPALELLRAALRRGAETGRAIHISPGPGAIGSRGSSAETIAGLLAAEQIASEAAFNGAPILASSGDAVAHLALRGALRQVYQRAGMATDYQAGRIELLAQRDPQAYAAGVSLIYQRQPLEASQVIGAFGPEALLLSESGAQRGVPQVIGATSPAALATLYLSAQEPLIGEEIFTIDAYLANSPAPQARLLTHDTLRGLVIGLLIAGVLYALLAPLLGLPALPAFGA